MQSETPDIKNLQDRLCRLELQNHRLKQLGIAALIVVTCLVGMGQATSTKTVDAHEFILRDNGGNVRARLSMNENSHPEMVFIDEKGGARIKLEGDSSRFYGGVVRVFDSHGQQGGIFAAGESAAVFHCWIRMVIPRPDCRPATCGLLEESDWKMTMATPRG